LYGLGRLQGTEQLPELEHVVGKRVGARVIAAQRAQRRVIGAGGATEAEIDAAGDSDSSVPNCSAITSGEWFGNMMPPAPTRIVRVPAAT
jgi:hypothetical protein